MSLRNCGLAGSLALLVAITAAWSQPPGGGRPGGFFGFGPPGGGPAAIPMLLAMPEVQLELNLSVEQKKNLEEAQVGLREATQKLFQDFNPQALGDLDADERDKRLADFRTKMEAENKQAEQKLQKLLDARQAKRLNELKLQREGVLALTRADMIDKLALNDDQVRQIRDLQPRGFGFGGPPPGGGPPGGPPPGGGPGGPPGMNNPQAMKDALAILNDKQKEQWTALTGAEFKFPPMGPGFMQAERKLVKDFDKDGDGRLNLEERKAARAAAPPQGGFGRGPGPGGPGPGGPGGFGRRSEPGKPGPKLSTADVQPVSESVPLYDEKTLRTIFLEFESPEWEAELADFNNTDVEVPATLIVDGKKYPGVGVHFRGMSSFGMVPAGSKRSLNVALDFVDPEQRLYGYKTLNLLNAHEDPTFMHTVLYSHIAREYIPAPKANFVKVVINGESWGLYVSAQQFDKIFAAENFHAKGTRWKVRGSPGGGGGLDYVGEDLAEYKRRYEMKSDDKASAWKALIKLCRTLKETPPEQLEAALAPMLDIEGALWFLALDNALINSDGYWIRGSDYCLFLDEKGKFHVIPHDMNETFQPPMGPGAGGPGGPGGRPPGGRDGAGPGGAARGGPPAGDRPAERPPQDRPAGGRPEAGRGPGGPGPGGFFGFGGGAGGGNYKIDPLVGLDDPAKPLRSKLLAVPSLRKKYLANVRTIAEKWLDWKQLGPLVADYRALIEKEVEADTRKLSSFAAFQEALAEKADSRDNHNLFRFATERRKFLLEQPKAD